MTMAECPKSSNLRSCVNHFSHSHPFRLIKVKAEEELICSGCGLNLSDWSQCLNIIPTQIIFSPFSPPRPNITEINGSFVTLVVTKELALTTIALVARLISMLDVLYYRKHEASC
ncbi:hypothetical protein CRYUN_Cryun04dG0034400 [Craigia yunnanensis]